VKKISEKLNVAVWVILISNVLGGIAFIIAYFLTKELMILIGGFFVIIAGIAFKLLMQKFIDKMKQFDS